MEKKQHLEDINKATLERLEAYMKAHASENPDDHQKIAAAKDKWQAAWNEFQETLLVLERLEI